VKILIDSSVWIDYFREGKLSEIMDSYIDENLICTNYLILSELIPPLILRKKNKLVSILNEVSKIPLRINWNRVIHYQTLCLKNGINKIGIADLIIVDNVVENDLILFSLDKHFKLMSYHIELNLV
jgi:predicted nucleic acid-binding protein